jgi:hypothetical protein
MPPSRLPKPDKPSSNKTNELHSETPENFGFYPSFYLAPSRPVPFRRAATHPLEKKDSGK